MKQQLKAGEKRGPFRVLRRVEGKAGERNRMYLCSCSTCHKLHTVSSFTLSPSQAKKCPDAPKRPVKLQIVIGETFGLLRIVGWGNPTHSEDGSVMASVVCEGCGMMQNDRELYRLRYAEGARACASCAARGYSSQSVRR